jgi:hypothetical protein
MLFAFFTITGSIWGTHCSINLPFHPFRLSTRPFWCNTFSVTRRGFNKSLVIESKSSTHEDEYLSISAR